MLGERAWVAYLCPLPDHLVICGQKKLGKGGRRAEQRRGKGKKGMDPLHMHLQSRPAAKGSGGVSTVRGRETDNKPDVKPETMPAKTSLCGQLLQCEYQAWVTNESQAQTTHQPGLNVYSPRMKHRQTLGKGRLTTSHP